MRKILWLQRFLCCIALGAMTFSVFPANAVSGWAYEIVSPPKKLEFEAGKLQKLPVRIRNTGSERWDSAVMLVARFQTEQGGLAQENISWREGVVLPEEEGIFLVQVPKIPLGVKGTLEVNIEHLAKGSLSELSGKEPLTIPFTTVKKSFGFLSVLINVILVCAILWIFSQPILRRFPKVKKLWRISKYPLAAAGVFLASRMVVLLAFATKFLYSSAASVNGNLFDHMISQLGRAWDGGWYLSILNNGYSFMQSGSSSIAFYPLYPLTGGILIKVFGISPELALLIVSNIFSILAVIVLYKLFEHLTRDPQKSLVGITLFSVFPTSLFLSAAYAESMFIFLIITALLLLLKFQKVVPAYSVAALALVTKVPGILLLPVFFCNAFAKSGKRWNFDREKLRLLPIILVPYALFLLYSKIKFGTFLAPFLAQKAWHGGGFFGMATNVLQKIKELFDFSLADMLGNQRLFFENYFLPKQLSLYECFSFLLLCLIVAGIVTFWKRLDRIVKLWCVFLTLFFLLIYIKSGMGFGVLSRFFMYYCPMFFVAGFVNSHIRNILIMVFTAMLFFTSFLFILGDVFIV